MGDEGIRVGEWVSKREYSTNNPIKFYQTHPVVTALTAGVVKQVIFQLVLPPKPVIKTEKRGEKN